LQNNLANHHNKCLWGCISEQIHSSSSSIQHNIREWCESLFRIWIVFQSYFYEWMSFFYCTCIISGSDAFPNFTGGADFSISSFLPLSTCFAYSPLIVADIPSANCLWRKVNSWKGEKKKNETSMSFLEFSFDLNIMDPLCEIISILFSETKTDTLTPLAFKSIALWGSMSYSNRKKLLRNEKKISSKHFQSCRPTASLIQCPTQKSESPKEGQPFFQSFQL